MMATNGAVLAPEPSGPFLSLEAADVTGTQSVVAQDVQGTALTGAVAKALAAMMRLPENVPWGLRDDATSRFLDDEKPIGEQLGPHAKVTVTPKTHLG
jgi:hypothetical protein